jgi:hypothetical protein
MITNKLCEAGGMQRVKTPQQAVYFRAAGETPWEARFKRPEDLGPRWSYLYGQDSVTTNPLDKNCSVDPGPPNIWS